MVNRSDKWWNGYFIVLTIISFGCYILAGYLPFPNLGIEILWLLLFVLLIVYERQHDKRFKLLNKKLDRIKKHLGIDKNK